MSHKDKQIIHKTMALTSDNIVITDATRVEMKDIDGSNEVRYTALVNGKLRLHFTTDGIERKHMSMEEWIEYAKQAAKAHI